MVNEYDDNLNNIIEIVKKYMEVISKSYKIEAIILFGSYAKGNNHKDSDIDVAVITDDIKSNRFDEELNLMMLRDSVDNRIEPHIITVEDYKTIGNPLVWEIVNTGIKVA